jgi:hypothetical protein
LIVAQQAELFLTATALPKYLLIKVSNVETKFEGTE